MSARIVTARPEHLVQVAAIYADAARTSVSTFDLDGTPIEYWQDKLAAPGPGDHFLVAVGPGTLDTVAVVAVGAGTRGDSEVVAVADAAVVDAGPVGAGIVDVGGVAAAGGPVGAAVGLAVDAVEPVLGFAYSGWFRPRPAYGRTRETSIYLHRDARGRGVGRALYDDLINRLRGDGIHLAVAVIAQPNPASVALHEALGFRLVGTFTEIGEKFGRYVDTRWYQLLLD